MSDTTKNYELKGDKLIIEVESTPKGIKTIVLNMDSFEMIETGTKVVNGKPVNYIKYKIK